MGKCKKKIGLTGFECRCGGLFCSIHRYANEHSCTFDYLAEGKKQLTKELPKSEVEKNQKDLDEGANIYIHVDIHVCIHLLYIYILTTSPIAHTATIFARAVADYTHK